MKKIICLFLCFNWFVKLRCQAISDSLLVNGYYRTFHFNKPSNDIKNYNLIFVLHGSGWNGTMMMKFASNLEKLSDKEHVLLVYPDGYNKSWNNCRKPASGSSEMNEEAFFNGMIDYFSKTYHINSSRAFAIGISAGGLMAYKLGMTMPEKFKAISVVVANMRDTMYCPESKKPIAVMITNGTKDVMNPYNGGPLVTSAGTTFIRSSDQSFKYWAALAGYKGQPSVEDLPLADSTGQRITRYTFKGRNKPEIALLQVHDMGHDNPKAVEIFLESWAFFKREIERERN